MSEQEEPGEENRNHSINSGSVYEEVMHPNEEKSVLSELSSVRSSSTSHHGQIKPTAFKNSAFVNWFLSFDELKLRPWLILNYSRQAIKR